MARYGQMRKDYVVLPGDQPRLVDPSLLPSARRIRHISDADLFRSLRLDRTGLEHVAPAARAQLYADAYCAWEAYFAARESPAPHPSPAKQRADLLADSDRLGRTISIAEDLVRHKVHLANNSVQFGRRFRFDYNGPGGQYCSDYMSWLEPLAAAYLATGEDRYVACFDEAFNQWYEVRDHLKPERGNEFHPVWNELSVAQRLRRWPTFYWIFRRSSALRPRTRSLLLKHTLGYARWLAEHEETLGFRGGNWQMIGAHALVYAARLMPEFKDSPQWLRIGLKWLFEHARRDFFKDGGHSERVTGYSGLCIRKLREVLEWADDIRLSPAKRRWLIRRLHLIYRWYLLTATPPHGTLAYGDAGYGDASKVLLEGFQFVRDRELLWPIRETDFARKHRPKKPAFSSVCARESGYAMMRESWEKGALYMSINFGPYGSPHTHNDLLNFDIFAYNTLLVADATRFGGYDCPLERAVRAAAAHNQIVVDDCDLDRLHAKGEQVLWSTQPHVDFFHALQRGYEKSHQVILERSIVFLRGEYWFISDVVREHQDHHSYTWYLHSPWRWRGGRDSCVQTRHSPGILVVPAAPDEIRHVRTGLTFDRRDSAGYLQPPYNERHWVGYQKYSYHEPLVSYGTALIPYRRQPPRGVKVRTLSVKQGAGSAHRGTAEAFEVIRGRTRDTIIFAHKSSGVLKAGDIETDARMAVVRLEGGSPTKVSAVGASRICVQGRCMLQSRKLREEFSWSAR